MILRMAALLAALTIAVWASAQSRAADQPGNDEIVVTAPEIDLAKRAVSISVQPPHAEQIARWSDTLHVQVYYAPAPAADYIRNRIGEIGRAVGLKVLPAGRQQPDVAIVFTGAASEFTRRLLKAHPALYRDTDQDNFPRRAEVAALLADRPVRWFEVRQQLGGGNKASRITLPTLYRKYMSYVIVDAGLVKGVNWQQLADYLAMVVLTEPGLDDGHIGENSILSLFSEGRAVRPEEVTALDRAVLKAFYGYTEDMRVQVQRAEMERSVAKNLKQTH